MVLGLKLLKTVLFQHEVILHCLELNPIRKHIADSREIKLGNLMTVIWTDSHLHRNRGSDFPRITAYRGCDTTTMLLSA